MCGRTTSYTPPQRLAEIFEADLAPDLDDQPEGPYWNVAPTNNLFGLAPPRPSSGGGSDTELGVGPGGSADLVLGAYRWGLIPPWSKDKAQGNRLFNARAETLSAKPAFRKAFQVRRLVVVVDGFYEWRRDPAGARQPFYFHRGDGFPMTFAGLWEIWKDPETESWLRSCSIITTSAGPDMQGIHDRMPVILERDELRRWLDVESADDSELMAFLRPAPPGTLVRYPVDSRVGNVRNDSPDLLRPLDGSGPDRQPTLFG
jgi:putative SOS response-associated peptidase YedK